MPATAAHLAQLEYSVLGEGSPTTVFAHGLGGCADDSRLVAARAPGRRVVFSFRGHGGSAPFEDGWDYPDLAADLRAVADETRATCAVGVSVGAGALLTLLDETPDRFDRVVLMLPAGIDRGRTDEAVTRLRSLGDLMSAGDEDGIAAVLLDEIPAVARDHRAARIYVRRRAAMLAGTVPPYARTDDVAPVADRAVLSRVQVPVLVVAQEGDPLHPLSVAQELAAALPRADLLVLPDGGVYWTDRFRMQAALATFLTP